MQDDPIGIWVMNKFLDSLPTKQPSQTFSVMARLGIPVTLSWVMSWLRGLKFKWSYLKCHSELCLCSTIAFRHWTLIKVIMVLNVLILERGISIPTYCKNQTTQNLHSSCPLRSLFKPCIQHSTGYIST